MQLRDLERAGAAFDESLKLSRLEGENIGMRSADYEVALTLDALDQLGELVGGPSDDLERERDAIMAKLAVIQLQRPPLPQCYPTRRSAVRARGPSCPGTKELFPSSDRRTGRSRARLRP